jgi:hypothetical protein
MTTETAAKALMQLDLSANAADEGALQLAVLQIVKAVEIDA